MDSNMLDQIVQDIKSKGWSFQENILTPHDMSLITKFFEENRRDFEAARIGKGETRQRRESIRGDYTLWIDPLNPPLPFQIIMSCLESLKACLNREIFLGAREYECHLAYYPPGTFYQKHVDRFENDSSRVLSFIFYLHDTWSPEEGGELILHTDKEVSISPVPGSLMIFLSENLSHEVRPGKRERRSFTGWMHSKIIY
jgi:SM-20-related protein